jgi:lipopolysaccharide/colanic/teichoic acid biosynthesis glycosyltransferase
LDVIASLLVLLLGLPVFGLIALMVKLSSPGPVFFVQERVGLGGKTFRLIKFRTMVPDAEQHPLGALTYADDPRVTTIGHVLRDYALDELPQLFNVLKGEMSLVGPRAPLPYQVQRYNEHQKKILTMKPGMTSWAFVNGRRTIAMPERLALHVWYVENWSFWLDVKILWRTLSVIVLREGTAEEVVPTDEISRLA